MVNEMKNSAFGEIRYQLDGMPTGYEYRTSTLEGHRSVQPGECSGAILSRFVSLVIEAQQAAVCESRVQGSRLLYIY
jgi:hypothetical protein